MIRSLLIANRGEIALRIIHSCGRLGVESIAICCDKDTNHPHVLAADNFVNLGGNSIQESYLCAEKIITAAKETGAEAIHPGYGFLSEDPTFAEKVSEAGLIFVGPSVEILKTLGHKHRARELATSLNIPTIPGYNGDDQNTETLLAIAVEIGFPLLVKASSGGGGRGMRRVETKEQLTKDLLESAAREATAAFGNGQLILEKIIAPARHIEVQLIGDSKGEVFHLFERECSLQRRFQKIIEVAPAQDLSKDLASKLHKAAVKIGTKVGLIGAATVEFLVRDENFYFLEVNPRIQVEHPVTEFITGLDLIELQLKVASGEDLPLEQKDIATNGIAIEARVYAEIPERDFIPSTGTIEEILFSKEVSNFSFSPDGTRIDHALQTGLEVGSSFDPMLLKLICGAPSYSEASAKVKDCLRETVIRGLSTNTAFLIELLSLIDQKSTTTDTSFVETNLHQLLDDKYRKQRLHAALASHLVLELAVAKSKQGSFFSPANWPSSKELYRIAYPSFENGSNFKAAITKVRPGLDALTVSIEERNIEIAILSTDLDNRKLQIEVEGKTFFLSGINFYHDTAFQLTTEFSLEGQFFNVSQAYHWENLEEENTTAGGTIKSPLPGTILSIQVKAGDQVQKGDPLIVIESMKIEHTIRSPLDGKIHSVEVSAGEAVAANSILLNVN